MEEDLLRSATVIVLGLLFAIPLYRMNRARRREALARWASDNGLKVIASRQPWISEASPFWFSRTKAQCIFQVTVEDAKGTRKAGWVRLGSVWRGLASPRAEVRWSP